MKVKLLTPEQKQKLVGQQHSPNSYFNTDLVDADGNYIMAIETALNCTNNNFIWVKDLPEIEYKPIIISNDPEI
jgi:hypothetical protein